MDRFKQSLDGAYAGQEDAIEVVEEALRTNMLAVLAANSMTPSTRTFSAIKRPVTVGGGSDGGGGGGGGEFGEDVDDGAAPTVHPLLLHFTGPTGVGKTLLTGLVKSSMFISECGVKKIHLDIGYKYNTDEGRAKRIDDDKRAVVEQLERCPRSLIVFDDFQVRQGLLQRARRPVPPPAAPVSVPPSSRPSLVRLASPPTVRAHPSHRQQQPPVRADRADRGATGGVQSVARDADVAGQDREDERGDLCLLLRP